MIEMKVINLTQHDVNVVNEDNETITFKPSGKAARVPMNQEVHGKIGPFKVYKKVYGEINFGVDIEPYNVYIVSNEVIRALNEQNHPLTYQFVAPNTIKSVSATIDRVIEDYIYKVTCDTVESVDKWTTTLNLNNLIMPTHWIGQKIYFRVYDKDKVLIPRPKNEPSQYSFTIKQDFTTGNSKNIEIIRGAQASLCGEKYGLVEPRYIKIEQKEGTNLPENYVPFDETRYIDVDYIY